MLYNYMSMYFIYIVTRQMEEYIAKSVIYFLQNAKFSVIKLVTSYGCLVLLMTAG